MDDRWQRLTRALQLAAILCVAIVWAVYLSRSVDAAGVGATLSRARGVPLALAALLVTVTPLARTAYWKSALAAARPIPYRLLLRYTLATNAANAVLPARAGDAMRVWLLRDRHDVPVARSAAAVVLEKTADVTALGLLAAPLPWLLPSLPEGVGQALRTVLVVIGVLLAALGIASRHATRSRWLAGLAVLREPSKLAPAFGAILATWLLDLGCVLLVMAAVGLTPRLADALLVLLFVNLATAIPASPGQLGTHELGALTALRLQGVDAEQAVAFALLYHAAQLVPVLALGLVDARSLLRARAPT
jgi:glycosyltransferase 2 family protein